MTARRPSYPPLTNEEMALAAGLRRQGKSWAVIAAAVKRPPVYASTLRNKLVDSGLVMVGRGVYPPQPPPPPNPREAAGPDPLPPWHPIAAAVLGVPQVPR